MIILHGHPVSTCTRKVLMTLGETETPYELKLVDFAKGEHKQEAHLARQPFGQIPTIEDGAFTLFESRAICRYLAQKAGSPLVPADLQGRARMDQWLSVEQSNFSGHAMKFIYHHTFKLPQEEAVLAAAGTALDVACNALSKPLATQPYLVGDQLTIADIGYLPYLEYVMASPASEVIAKHPHVAAWWTRISERPTWRKVAGR